jgi:hypothetical protein
MVRVEGVKIPRRRAAGDCASAARPSPRTLPVGLTAAARQAILAESIAEIFGGVVERDSPMEVREYVRPTRDSGSVEVT